MLIGTRGLGYRPGPVFALTCINKCCMSNDVCVDTAIDANSENIKYWQTRSSRLETVGQIQEELIQTRIDGMNMCIDNYLQLLVFHAIFYIV